jgi:hypothetical protein
VETTKDREAAAGHSVAAEDWAEEFESGFAYIAGRFRRVEPRRQARAFLLGLLSDVDTRSCWQLAEQAGDRTVNEIRRLFANLVATTHTITHWLAWSHWQLLHQARAKTSHYRRRDQQTHRPLST